MGNTKENGILHRLALNKMCSLTVCVCVFVHLKHCRQRQDIVNFINNEAMLFHLLPLAKIAGPGGWLAVEVEKTYLI